MNVVKTLFAVLSLFSFLASFNPIIASAEGNRLACYDYWCQGNPPPDAGNRSIFQIIGKDYHHSSGENYVVLEGVQWCKDGHAKILGYVASPGKPFTRLAPGESLTLSYDNSTLWTINNPYKLPFEVTNIPPITLKICLPLSNYENPWVFNLIKGTPHHNPIYLGHGQLFEAHGALFEAYFTTPFVVEFCWADKIEVELNGVPGLYTLGQSSDGVGVGDNAFFVTGPYNANTYPTLEIGVIISYGQCFQTGQPVFFGNEGSQGAISTLATSELW